LDLHARAGSRDDDAVNETWATAARYLSRYRGALLGGIGSAASVAVTLDPHANIATSSIKFALAFAMVATLVAIGVTMAISIAEYRSTRPDLPRATVRKRA
jgi:Zn-dependent protease